MRLDMSVIQCRVNIHLPPCVEAPPSALILISSLLLSVYPPKQTFLSCDLHFLSSHWSIQGSKSLQLRWLSLCSWHDHPYFLCSGWSLPSKVAFRQWNPSHLQMLLKAFHRKTKHSLSTISFLYPQIHRPKDWFIWAKKSFSLVKKSCSSPKSPTILCYCCVLLYPPPILIPRQIL